MRKLNDNTIKIMVEFGNTILDTKKRKSYFRKDKDLPPIEDRMKVVNDVDLSNFISKKK